jgi:hypothetical protein
LVVLAAALVILNDKLTAAPLGRFVRADLPMLDVIVVLKDVHNDELDAEGTRIAEARETPEGSEHCPALLGGDDADATRIEPDDKKRPADCPRVAGWYVKVHPIAFSLYFNDGQAFLDWFDANPRVQEIVANKFFQGLFFQPARDLRVKAEDLRLPGLEGELLGRVLREAIAANAQLHYDMAHGKRGFALAFPREAGAFTARALPLMAGALARNGYRIAKLPNPVLEMRVGSQSLFLTQYGETVYLANGFEALLNVIESLTPPSVALDAPVSLTLRAEAFLEKILETQVGADQWDINLGFALDDKRLGALSFPTGRFAHALHPRLFGGVLSAVPHDAFAAAAGAFYLSPTQTADEWRQFATQGPAETPANAPAEAGFALVWDFDAEQDPFGQVGVVIANQTTPDAAEAFRQYLADPELGAACAGGAAFVAASSEKLLERMKEACDRRSLSVLDWQRGGVKARFESAQLAAFVNPGVGLRELFLAGGAGGKDPDASDEFEPRWKQEYEQAKAAMRKEGEKLFRGLPIFAYSGQAGNESRISLEGFAVQQGEAP